jgi:transketolase
MEENTRKAFGNAMVAADANRPDIVALDGELSDSTFTEVFNRA